MTDQNHPVTPPPELVQQWLEKTNQELGSLRYNRIEAFNYGATQAARWGADQELEACCEWLRNNGLYETRIGHLRAARRPQPPSLKEQALMALEDGDIGPGASLTPVEVCIIRRALEQLND